MIDNLHINLFATTPFLIKIWKILISDLKKYSSIQSIYILKTVTQLDGNETCFNCTQRKDLAKADTYKKKNKLIFQNTKFTLLK